MLRYAESRNQPLVNWWAIIADGQRTGRESTLEEHMLSGSYVTCACGQQCDKIPRFAHSGVPKDRVLSNLGLDFCSAIVDSEWSLAQDLLLLIEKRSSLLLEGLTHADQT